MIDGREFKLSPKRVNLESWHDFQSLFPNVTIRKAADVLIPQNELERWNKMVANNETVADEVSKEPRELKGKKVGGKDEERKQEKVEDEVEASMLDNLKHLIDKFWRKGNGK